MTVKPYSWRLNEKIVSEIYNIADECHSKRTFMIEKALEQYVESYRLQKKASLLSQEVIDVQKSLVDLLEHRINNRSNQLLSSMAIQQFVLCKVIAESLGNALCCMDLFDTMNYFQLFRVLHCTAIKRPFTIMYFGIRTNIIWKAEVKIKSKLYFSLSKESFFLPHRFIK